MRGGFDAVIGNPPWDQIEQPEVEWFALRDDEVALAGTGSKRKELIKQRIEEGQEFALEYDKVRNRAISMRKFIRSSGEYPLLSGGRINQYSLFVERAMTLVNAQGMVGLLTPSGIASDLTAAKFFKGVATEGRLRALYDFENRRTRYKGKPFFPMWIAVQVLRFSSQVRSPSENPAKCAFYPSGCC